MNYIFSIIIPILNTENLMRSINSVIAQDYGFSRIQLVLVNRNGETEAKEICEKYVSSYPDNIEYLEGLDWGIAVARNKGIEVACGKFIGFLDAGDVLSKNACNVVNEYFNIAQEYVDVAVVPIYNFDHLEGPHYLNRKFAAGTRTLDLKDAKWYDVCTRVSHAFIRTETAKKYRFDELLSEYEDTKFINEILMEKKRVGLVSKAKYYLRRYADEVGRTATRLEDEKAKEFYLEIPRKTSLYYLDLAEREDILTYLRYLVLPELKWRLFFKSTPASEYLSAEEYEGYRQLSKTILSKIPDKIIFEADIFHFWQKVYLINMKYGTNILEAAEYDAEGRLLWNGFLLSDLVKELQVNLLDIDIVKDELYLKGYVCGLLVGNVSLNVVGENTKAQATLEENVVSTTIFPLEEERYKYSAFEVKVALPEEQETLRFVWTYKNQEYNINKVGISLSGVAEHVRPITQEKAGYKITRTSKGIAIERADNNTIYAETYLNEEQFDKEQVNKEDAIVIDNVSVRFNLSPEKVDSFKDYIIKSIKGQIRYEEHWALQDISFALKKGERLGILGLNGSGKSTLLKVIAGVYKPTTGSVKRSGLILPMLELGAGFDMEYTGKENVFLYGSVLGFDREFMSAHYDEIAEFSELGKFMDVPLKNYSSGMRSRLGFAIATVVKPDILILDEVLSVGDAKFKKKSEDKMLELIENGTTVLFVSHSLAQVKKICNKAIILSKGKMLAYGDIDEVSVEYERITEE